jgi:hypothetical protein
LKFKSVSGNLANKTTFSFPILTWEQGQTKTSDLVGVTRAPAANIPKSRGLHGQKHTTAALPHANALGHDLSFGS